MSLILSGTDGLSDVDGTAATPAIRGTDANTGIFFPAADTIAFAEGGAEVARFDSSGNLGIGTASPAQTLHVKTSTSATPITLGVLSNATGLPALSFNGAYASTTMAGIYGNGGTSTSLYYEVPSGNSHFFGIADVTKMTLDASGNLLVGGTSNPASARFIAENVSGNQIGLRYTSVATWYNSVDSSGNYIWKSDSTERMRIDSSGNLMVGTTSQILSNTKFNFSSSQGVALGGMGFVNTVAPSIKWQIGPDNAGNFVIFNGSAVGVYIANGATAWTAYSDERLKTTIIPFENAAAKVATLRAGTGRYLKDAEGTSRSFLIAQDVQKILPEAVDANNPDALGLSYTDVIPLLVAAINEQQALIIQLTARITALESA